MAEDTSTGQTTPKSTENTQIRGLPVDLHKTPEQVMEELVALSQEWGLYDITNNPLIRDTPIELHKGTVGVLNKVLKGHYSIQ